VLGQKLVLVAEDGDVFALAGLERLPEEIGLRSRTGFEDLNPLELGDAFEGEGRLEVLLGEACRYGAHHTGVSFESLVEVLAETHGFNLARSAWIEERDRQKLNDLLDILEERREVVA